MEKPTNYRLEKSPFFRLGSKQKLSELLQVNKKELLLLSKKQPYHSFEKVVAEKVRHIDTPKKSLYSVQGRIKDLLARIETPHWLFSGKKGVSYIDNAKFHQHSSFVVTCDIKAFYSNCTKERIFQIFKYNFQVVDDVAWILANLLSYEEKVPTGSPSSQVIAYWAYYPTFQRIYQLVKSYDAKISLYVDDITVSSEKEILKDLVYKIKNELEKVGHTIKESKTKSYRKNEFKLITGVAISNTGELKVPNRRRKKLKDSLAEADFSKKSIVGQISSAQMIEAGYQEKVLSSLKDKK